MSTPQDPYAGSRLPPELDPRRGSRGPVRRPGPAVPHRAAGGSAPVAPGSTPPPDGAPAGPYRRGPRYARVLSWLALGTSLSVLAVAALGYVLINHYNGNIQRLPLYRQVTNVAQPAAAPRGAENILLVGSDSREGSNGVGTQGRGASFVTGQRSDTVILAHLFGGRSQKAELVSFPRDAKVQVPEWTDPVTKAVHPAHKAKLNAAYGEGGQPLLIATIELLTNIRIDHFVQIDFEGFKGMVNKLGGVDVCLTKSAKEHDSGIDLSAGHHHVNGEQALSFVRQRKGLENGDIDRIARQQYFIGAVARKVLSAGTLLNPIKLNGFLDVATSSLQVDSALSAKDLRNLALRLRGFNAGGVLFVTVPIADIGGHDPVLGDVVLLDQAKDDALFDQLRADLPPGAKRPTAAPPATPLVVAPAAVRVRVYNGSGVAGVGRRAVQDLNDVGFTVIGTAGNRGTGAGQTVISYGPTKADSARTLAAALPGSVLQADPNLGRTLEVVVGSSYSGARSVTVTGTATPAPSAGTTPVAAKPTSAQAQSCAP